MHLNIVGPEIIKTNINRTAVRYIQKYNKSRDFNAPLSSMDRLLRQNIKKQ